MHSTFTKSMLRARVPAGVFLGSGLVAGGVVVGMQSPALCGTGNSEYWDGQLAARDPVGAAGRKSAAFVFIKPHAVYPKAIELVKAKFAASGIAVTSEGTLDWKTIDSKMLIDTHYGAIANRAVKQKPSELVVPEKAKVAFQKAFGLSWDSALSQGLVYNAVDGCTKLGVDGAGLDKKWSKLKRGADMIKFGGGFYAGKVDGIYVMNGFYMAMRGAYTTAPAQIHYFTVEWPTATLSWEDFRGSVLGATDPAAAADGSARKMIHQQWRALGLQAEPDTGDNGVHASASPFEALAERVNWLGASLEDDFYGKGMLAAGVTAQMITAWSADPNVLYQGTNGSIFDKLEDLNSDVCLAKAADIAKSL